MTLDEHRAKCIEAMCRVRVKQSDPSLNMIWQDFFEEMMTIFDSLHGIARVVPVEATDEMIEELCSTGLYDDEANQLWRAASRVGDLTNPPEKL